MGNEQARNKFKLGDKVVTKKAGRDIRISKKERTGIVTGFVKTIPENLLVKTDASVGRGFAVSATQQILLGAISTRFILSQTERNNMGEAQARALIKEGYISTGIPTHEIMDHNRDVTKAHGFLEGLKEREEEIRELVESLEAIVRANKVEGAENLGPEDSFGNGDDQFSDGRTKGENYVAIEIEKVLAQHAKKYKH